MINNSNPLFNRGQNPWIMLLSLIGISIGGFLFIGYISAIFAAMLMTGLDFEELTLHLADPTAYPEMRAVMLVIQGIVSSCGFIVAPLIFYYTMVNGKLKDDFFPKKSNFSSIIALAICVVFCFMVVNSLFIEWNANIELPAFLDGFEKWAKHMEDTLADQTKYLTRFDSTSYFLMAILVVAVIPGIGEELLFRGMLQNVFRRIVKNDHAAIWITAFLFSAIHFQFYGFLPRMLLGALFGYMYLWTGNLLVPMVAHFFNNAISLISLYIYQKGLTDFDIESSDALPGTYVALFAILFVTLLLYFKNFVKQNNGKLEHRI